VFGVRECIPCVCLGVGCDMFHFSISKMYYHSPLCLFLSFEKLPMDAEYETTVEDEARVEVLLAHFHPRPPSVESEDACTADAQDLHNKDVPCSLICWITLMATVALLSMLFVRYMLFW
jgi:hypothetical protein